MTKKEYSIATLMDIAMIPTDRLPALLAELPRCLDTIRPFALMKKALPKEQVEVIAKSLLWVDDGCTDGEHDETIVTFTYKKP